MNTTDILSQLPPTPVLARHAEYSMIFSADDELSKPSDRLFDIALPAIAAARGIDLSALSARMSMPPYYPDIWPGEHYKLLAALVQVLAPTVVIEIGTASGLSALALKLMLPEHAVVHTFDLRPWNSFPETVLRPDDFDDRRLVAHAADLTDPHIFAGRAELLQRADFIFIDAAKDRICEPRLLENLKNLRFVRPPIVMFDDIRLWNMLAIWRAITLPKLDLTSFGHWSGTGLVDWCQT